jgi:hypothetical protein
VVALVAARQRGAVVTAGPTPGRGWRIAVGVVAAANAVGALGGSVGLAGSWLTLGDLDDRLPLDSHLLAGTALALLVCLPQTVLAVAARRRSSLAAALSVCCGAVLVGWILLEVVFLRVFAGLQVAYVVIGVVQVGLGLLLGRHDPGVSARQLLGMVAAVVADVPRFVSSPLVRRRHLRWGASDEEVAAFMPGDELVPEAQYVATRAVDVQAPPDEVWPWLVQVGADRAGWYSDDLLDHGGRPSDRVVRPEWQDLAVGDVVAMSGHTPPRPARSSSSVPSTRRTTCSGPRPTRPGRGRWRRRREAAPGS